MSKALLGGTVGKFYVTSVSIQVGGSAICDEMLRTVSFNDCCLADRSAIFSERSPFWQSERYLCCKYV